MYTSPAMFCLDHSLSPPARATAGAIAAAVLLGAGCFRNDLRVVEVRVPQMATPECSKVILDALGRIEFVVSATPDVASRTVTVSYDSTKLALKNIEIVIANAGFDANEIPASPQARQNLPPECQGP